MNSTSTTSNKKDNDFDAHMDLNHACILPGTIVRMPLAPPAGENKQTDTSWKQHPSRENARSISKASDSENEEELRQQDPFLFFSDKERQMRYITDGHGTSSRSQDARSLSPIKRKTCISFEVHPSLLLDDLVLDMDVGGLNESSDSIDDLLCILAMMEMMQVNEEEECQHSIVWQ